MKLDVLDGIKEIKVLNSIGNKIKYDALSGWDQSTVGIKDYSRLPENAKKYLNYLEKELGTKIDIISTGPERYQTISN